MAKQDYIPRPDGDFLTWHDNFKTQIAATATTFGLLPAETEALTAGNIQLHAKYDAALAAKAMSAAKNADKLDSFKTCITAARALANRIKTHPAYTPAFGQQLGIVGAEDSTDLTQEKPTLKATAVTPGSVTIGFNKSTSSGVRIHSKRGPETAFSFLAIDTASPYIDTRANLTAGAPESRQYQAQYLDGDDLVGQLSDILSVTVPS